MKIRPPILRAWTGDEAVDVDLFAGGGGASEGKRRATGRSPDVAVNHWPAAIAMHKVNHPDCRHFVEDVYKVKPSEATEGKRCRFLWMSPTCTHFSRAKGAALKDRKIRGLAWSIMPWIAEVRPEVIVLENVVEFLTWGPLHRQHVDGCRGDKQGEGCLKRCIYGKPIKERSGETFNAWERRIRSYGYSFEARRLVAWQFGAPTTRERLYVIMRADGQPSTWPEPTHTRATWRTAAEIIDWSIRCPSIFERKRRLKPKTEARLARGVVKFALQAEKPFLIHVTHGAREHSLDQPTPTVTAANRGEMSIVAPMLMKAKTYSGGGNDAKPADEPVGTVLASKRGEIAVAQAELAYIMPNNTNNVPKSVGEPVPTVTGGNRNFLAVPYMVHRSNGERPGQAPRVYDVRAPHPTVVAGGVKTAPAIALITKHHGGNESSKGGQDPREPLATVCAQDQKALTVAHIVKYYGTSTGSSCDEPLHTVPAMAEHHAVSATFLSRYNGERRPGEDARGVSMVEPVSTVDTSNRFGLVDCALADWTPAIEERAHRVYEFLLEYGHDGPWMDHEQRLVWLDRDEGVVVYDIGMRMLVPRELFRANGFTDDYVIDLVGPKGKPLTKTEQIRMVGNTVCPDVADAIWRAVMKGPGKQKRERGQLSLGLEAA